MNHLVIVGAPTIDKILSGQKVLESRFGRLRRPAAWRSQPGDRLYFKAKGGDLLCAATVGEVLRFDNLTPDAVMALERDWWQWVHGPTRNMAYWQGRAHSDFLVLVEIVAPRAICVSSRVLPQNSPWASAWFTIDESMARTIDQRAATPPARTPSLW